MQQGLQPYNTDVLITSEPESWRPLTSQPLPTAAESRQELDSGVTSAFGMQDDSDVAALASCC